MRRRANPLDRARALTELRRRLDVLEVEIVDDAYGRFTSWSEIGRAFGVRKQTIWAKHRHRHR